MAYGQTDELIAWREEALAQRRLLQALLKKAEKDGDDKVIRLSPIEVNAVRQAIKGNIE